MPLREVTPSESSPFLGLSDREKKKYSIVRAINELSQYGKLEGLERECSEEVAKRTQQIARGFFIPGDITMNEFSRVSGDTLTGLRALNATTATAGGFTVSTETDTMIDLLRNKMVVAQLGARVLPNLVGNLAIPRQTGGATAYWLSETEEVTASQQSFGQVAFTPHRLAGLTYYTKQLLVQTGSAIESFVREDLMTVLALEKDRAAINGIGAAGEPLGILNTTGINSITFGGAPTWQDAVDLETLVEDDNVQFDGTTAYVTTPTAKGKWKTTQQVSGQAVFLWQNNTVNGYTAVSTKQIPSDRMIFGKWSDLIIADWQNIDVVVDPISMATTGQTRVIINILTDCGTRYPQSFAASIDSAAQ